MSKPFQNPFPLRKGLRVAESTFESVSIVVPFFNEQECVEDVLQEIKEAQPEAEIVAVDDGSSDDTWALISQQEGVSGLRLTENRGQSGALYAGFQYASGDLMVMLDGDGQNDPADIGRLLEILRAGSADVVCGRRAVRKDTASRRVASKIANRIRRLFLNDGISDTGCSLKAFHKDHVDLLVPFNGLHRYLPAIFLQAGLRISEVDVNHRERAAGQSKYTNLDRALRGIHDLIGVSWLLKRKVNTPALELSRNQDR